MANEATTSAQTGAPGKPDTNEIASIARQIGLQAFGGVLLNTDSTLLTRGGARGLAIYEDLKRDCHAGAVLNKRRLAVISRDWDVTPASNSRIDKKAADLVKSCLQNIEFDRICGSLLDAVLKGFAVSEVMWDVIDGEWRPVDVKGRSPQRFAMTVDGRPRLRVPEDMNLGIELPERKFVVQRFGASDDFPYGLGLGHALFWPVMFKRQDLSFWLKFVDKFGAPTAVGKYPNGTSETEQTKLLQALSALSNDAGIIVPEGMLVDLLRVATTTDSFEKLARYLDEQISECVLGETMSTTAAGAGLGSSQADVQDDVRLEIAKADSRMLDGTLNATLVKWIVEFNLPNASAPAVHRKFDEEEDLDTTADRDQKLYAMGYQRTPESVAETYGTGYVPRDMSGGMVGPDGLPVAASQNSPAAPGDVTLFAEVPASLAKVNVEAQDHLREAAAAAAADWQSLVGPKVKRLQAVLAETGDLVQFREALARLVDEPPSDDLVDRLARGSFAAHVMGRGPAKKPGLFTRLFGRGKAATSRP